MKCPGWENYCQKCWRGRGSSASGAQGRLIIHNSHLAAWLWQQPANKAIAVASLLVSSSVLDTWAAARHRPQLQVWCLLHLQRYKFLRRPAPATPLPSAIIASWRANEPTICQHRIWSYGSDQIFSRIWFEVLHFWDIYHVRWYWCSVNSKLPPLGLVTRAVNKQ